MICCLARRVAALALALLLPQINLPFGCIRNSARGTQVLQHLFHNFRNIVCQQIWLRMAQKIETGVGQSSQHWVQSCHDQRDRIAVSRSKGKLLLRQLEGNLSRKSLQDQTLWSCEKPEHLSRAVFYIGNNIGHGKHKEIIIVSGQCWGFVARSSSELLSKWRTMISSKASLPCWYVACTVSSKSCRLV